MTFIEDLHKNNRPIKYSGLIFCILFFVVSMYGFEQKINIDGKFEEPNWNKATVFNQFKTFQPTIGIDASEKTDVLITNDSLNLYIAVRAYDSDPSKNNCKPDQP